MKTICFAFALAMSLGLNTSAHAQEQDSAAFDSAYAEFQAAVAAGDLPEAARLGGIVYGAGRDLFGDGSPELARLGLNHGRATLAAGQGPAAVEILYNALNQHKAAFGDDGKELITVYVSLAEAFSKSSGRLSAAEQDKAYSEAVRITGIHQGETSQAVGLTELKAGIGLLDRAQSPLAGPHLERAYTILSTELGTKNPLTGQAAFYVGKFHMAGQDLAQASDWFGKTISTFEDPDRPKGQLEFSAHLLNVQALEAQGRSGEATQSAQAIGRMQPRTESDDIQPLYTVSPQLPTGMKLQPGTATVSFLIDETGRVQNPEVTESNVSEAVEQAAVQAIQSWRFAPRFDGDTPVTQEATQSLNFGPRG